MTILFTRFAAAALAAACLSQAYYIHTLMSDAGSPAREFQARHDQWVAEIEDLKRRTAPPQQEEQESLLGGTFEDWFQARAAVSAVKSSINITDEQVIVSFAIPGLKAESLKITVNEVLIRASFNARASIESRDLVRHFETIMPMPQHADAGRYRIAPGREGFKIIFEKREDPRLKS